MSEEVAFRGWAHMEVVNLVPRFSVGTGGREPWERGWEVVWLNTQNWFNTRLKSLKADVNFAVNQRIKTAVKGGIHH